MNDAVVIRPSRIAARFGSLIKPPFSIAEPGASVVAAESVVAVEWVRRPLVAFLSRGFLSGSRQRGLR
jgi:hypothetical protein